MVIQRFSNTTGDPSEPYLGFITPTLIGEEFYKVHAYAAATGFKIIAIINEMDASITAIKKVTKSYGHLIYMQLFEGIHILFANAICNPLMTMKFKSPNFDAELCEFHTISLKKVAAKMVAEFSKSS